MSSNLIWFTEPKRKDLPHELKLAFQRLYGSPVDTILTESHTAQLKAMAVVYDQAYKKAIVRELRSLINAIDKYKYVYLREDFR